MIIGYFEKVNKIVVYDLEGKRFTRHLAVYGLNNYNSFYSYYNAKDGKCHYLEKSLISKIKLYHDNELICEI